MSELAFNLNGERFEVPEEAEFWRVRRFKPSGRGTPEVVFHADGLPLVIPIDTDIHEFRRLVRMEPGRYRLDAIDRDCMACEDGMAAYVQLAAANADGAEEPAAEARHDDLIRELVQVNAEMVRSITDKFAMMMESAATLLRAADGAGMPAREPAPAAAPVFEDDDDDDDHRNAGGFDLGALMAQMVPLFQMVMAQRNQGESAQRTRNGLPEVEHEEGELDDEEAEGAGAERLDSPGPETMAHLAAIESALTPDEARLARAVVCELSPPELAQWIGRLSQLSVEEAVRLIRAMMPRAPLGSEPPGAAA